MSGIILVDKPAGWTSFDVCAKIRGITRIKRVGHSGTLDPMATGVLPVFLGRATGAIDLLPDGEKRYEARFRLGFSTDTQDITGEILEKSGKIARRSDIEAALSGFIGKISQLPPMYSAVRVNGRRLYDLARRGEEVERAPREIEIYSIKLTDFSEDEQSGGLSVSCSKGTYIRTLIDDLGRRIGTLGTMTELRRTYSQGFEISRCRSVDEIAAAEDPMSLAVPVESCFEGFGRIDLSAAQEKMFRNGVRLDPRRVKISGKSELYRVYGSEFLGLAEIADGELRLKKSFWEI